VPEIAARLKVAVLSVLVQLLSKLRVSVSPEDEKAYADFMARLNSNEKELLSSGLNFYELKFRNVGGLVMPLIIQFNFVDGTSEIKRIPAEIWRLNEWEVSKVFPFAKEVKSILLDPMRETADINEENNYWPRQFSPSRFELFKGNAAPRGSSGGAMTPMKKAKAANK
jgi:hypothetical protein